MKNYFLNDKSASPFKHYMPQLNVKIGYEKKKNIVLILITDQWNLCDFERSTKFSFIVEGIIVLEINDEPSFY